MKIGIDATNIRNGGGLTHLKELLAGWDSLNISEIECVIWIGPETCEEIPKYQWISKRITAFNDNNLIFRLIWNKFFLDREIKELGCNVMFSPGGIFLGSFSPSVSMSQNLLPFTQELFPNYSFIRRGKLNLIKFLQIKTFAKSDGVIFLHQYAKNIIDKNMNDVKIKKVTFIPHGISEVFINSNAAPHVSKDTLPDFFRIVYTSRYDEYKNHDTVVRSVFNVRKLLGLSIELVLIGEFNSIQIKHIKQLTRGDASWIVFAGGQNHQQMADIYKTIDLAIFASSCENLPIILLEKMVNSLPILCSNLEPMNSIITNKKMLFNPCDSNELTEKLSKVIIDPILRRDEGEKNFKLSRAYNWKVVSLDTYNFLKLISKS